MATNPTSFSELVLLFKLLDQAFVKREKAFCFFAEAVSGVLRNQIHNGAADLREGAEVLSLDVFIPDVVDQRAHQLNLSLGSGHLRFHVLVELAAFLRHPLNRINLRHYGSRRLVSFNQIPLALRGLDPWLVDRTFRGVAYVSVWVVIWGTVASLMDWMLLTGEVYETASAGQAVTFIAYGAATVVLATRFSGRFLVDSTSETSDQE